MKIKKRQFIYISPVQKSVLDYLIDHLNRFGFAPTQAEIGKALNMGRTSVEYHIKELHKKGYVDKHKEGYRNLRVLAI